jgi:hypothetical protein
MGSIVAVAVAMVAGVGVIIAQVPSDALPWVERGGVIGLLTLALIAFVRGWVHTDKEFQVERADKEFYREMAFANLKLATDGVQVAKSIARQELEEMAVRVDDARRKGQIK